MDTRKDYVAPAIAAEDDLEQTSLACNCTARPDEKLGTFTAGACRVDTAKGGAFAEFDQSCTVFYPTGLDDFVVLS